MNMMYGGFRCRKMVSEQRVVVEKKEKGLSLPALEP
jgi:hypothetical protein